MSCMSENKFAAGSCRGKVEMSPSGQSRNVPHLRGNCQYRPAIPSSENRFRHRGLAAMHDNLARGNGGHAVVCAGDISTLLKGDISILPRQFAAGAAGAKLDTIELTPTTSFPCKNSFTSAARGFITSKTSP